MEIQPDVSVENENESDLFIPKASVRQSQIAAIQSIWNARVSSAVDRACQVDPFETNLPEGVVVPTIDAVDWNGRRGCDIRPRLWDAASKKFRLVDSGSMITATAKLPTDKVDNTFNLVAVNGSQIKTYGVRKLEVKINRKKYEMEAIVCDINQDILGMDFLNNLWKNLWKKN